MGRLSFDQDIVARDIQRMKRGMDRMTKQNQTLPEYLKNLRKSCHYTQEEVAAHLHISRQTYSHYETGRIKPSINVLYHLAKLYGVSVDAILGHIESSFSEQKFSEQEAEEIEKTDFEKIFSCLCCLNEKNREETLSIMWEIVQAKIMKQKIETTEKKRMSEEWIS